MQQRSVSGLARNIRSIMRTHPFVSLAMPSRFHSSLCQTSSDLLFKAHLYSLLRSRDLFLGVLVITTSPGDFVFYNFSRLPRA